jgi:hypothetical protein
MVIAALAAITIVSAAITVHTSASTGAGGTAEVGAVARRTGRVFAFDSALAGPGAPRGDVPGWRQVFFDDFNVDVPLGSFPSAVKSAWGAYPYPAKDTTKRGTYWPEKVVSINDGVLTKYLHVENGTPLVAALTPKVPGTSKYGQLYGRYEVRFRADRAAPGYKIAWMLWPDSGTNTTGAVGGGGNGEIDYPEGELSDITKMWGFVHHQNATVGSDQDWFRVAVDVREWHTYTMEWSPGLVVFRLDGTEIGRTTERVPNTPMHWVLQSETSLKTTTPADAKVNLMIDWVAAWVYAPGT